MNDFAASLIRTYVPIAVGAVVAWLTTLNVVIDESSKAGLVVALTGILSAVYYTVVRALEKKFPWIGALLGKAAAPVYVSPKEISPANSEVVVEEVAAKVDNLYSGKNLY